MTGRLRVPLGAASLSRLSRLTGRVRVPLGARSLRIVLTLTERSKEPGSSRVGVVVTFPPPTADNSSARVLLSC